MQAEAIPPDTLAGIVETAIRERIDANALDEVLTKEERIRRWAASDFRQATQKALAELGDEV